MEAKVGDTIVCKGDTVIISEILYQDCWDGVWIIEFRCVNGILRSWKQGFDGGILIQK